MYIATKWGNVIDSLSPTQKNRHLLSRSKFAYEEGKISEPWKHSPGCVVKGSCSEKN